MPKPTQYETGARKLQPATGPDPRDDFSQKAAENRKPPLGIGLTESIDERSETDKSDLQDQATEIGAEGGQTESTHAVSNHDPEKAQDQE